MLLGKGAFDDSKSTGSKTNIVKYDIAHCNHYVNHYVAKKTINSMNREPKK